MRRAPSRLDDVPQTWYIGATWGFKQATNDLLAALASSDYAHEPREVITGKNLLAIGDLSAADVVRIVSRATGRDYSTSPHHWAESVIVHVFDPVVGDVHWYIKVYFLDDESRSAVFISVHATGAG